MFFAIVFGLWLLSCDLGTVDCARVKIKKHALLKESLPQGASALSESKVSDQSPLTSPTSISGSVAPDNVELNRQRSRAAGADGTASHAPIAVAQPQSIASAMIALSSVVASVRAHVPAPSIHAGYLSLLVGTGLFITCFCIGGLRFRKRRDFPNPRTTRRFSKDAAQGTGRRLSTEAADGSDDVVRCKSYVYKPEEDHESDDESTDVGEASDSAPFLLQHQYSMRSEVDGEDAGQLSTTIDGQSSMVLEGNTPLRVDRRMQSIKEVLEEVEEGDSPNDAKPAAATEDSEDGLIEF